MPLFIAGALLAGHHAVLASMSEGDQRLRVLIRRELAQVAITENGRSRTVSWTSPLPMRFISYGEPLIVDDRPFRGEIVIERAPGARTIRVINEIDLEDYLRGVVPSEMPATWPREALMAQAVAARTYAVHSIAGSRARARSAYDLDATVHDQVYLGLSVETEATDSAVHSTVGQLLEYESSPIRAYFHSACGGITEIPENVWGGASAGAGRGFVYRHVVDTWCAASPHSAWRSEFSLGDLRKRLARISLREILSLSADTRNESGRVKSFSVEGTLRTSRVAVETVRGQEFRMLLGAGRIRSLRLELAQEQDSWVFTGSGWGHGVGLCQWGARGMAEAGFDYRRILANYYPGSTLRAPIAADGEMPTIIFPRQGGLSITNTSITP
jgi:stage II sporulation protein D